MSSAMTSFADLLRHLRTTAALSQEELSERSGLSLRGISDLERGVRRAPHLTTVRVLADALALSPTDRQALLAAARPGALPGTPQAASGGCALLPLPLTPLLGRERELTTLVSLLGSGDIRLVTLTGAGGSGKTRLALEVGARLQGRIPRERRLCRFGAALRCDAGSLYHRHAQSGCASAPGNDSLR